MRRGRKRLEAKRRRKQRLLDERDTPLRLLKRSLARVRRGLSLVPGTSVYSGELGHRVDVRSLGTYQAAGMCVVGYTLDELEQTYAYQRAAGATESYLALWRREIGRRRRRARVEAQGLAARWDEQPDSLADSELDTLLGWVRRRIAEVEAAHDSWEPVEESIAAALMDDFGFRGNWGILWDLAIETSP